MLGEAADSATPAKAAPGATDDSLGDELLELAGDEGAEFGLTGGVGGESNLYTMSADELGIQERLAAGPDSEETKRNEAILGRALRAWAKDMRERERSRKLREPPSRPRNGVEADEKVIASVSGGAGVKRARANDYDSDSGDSMPDVSELRRSRRSTRSSSALRRRSSRFGWAGGDEADVLASSASSMEAAQAAIRNARARYLVEKAKLRYARTENARLWQHLETLQAEHTKVQRECTVALEQALVFELGADVDAIFTPPASPNLGAAQHATRNEAHAALKHEVDEQHLVARGTLIEDQHATTIAAA